MPSNDQHSLHPNVLPLEPNQEDRFNPFLYTMERPNSTAVQPEHEQEEQPQEQREDGIKFTLSRCSRQGCCVIILGCFMFVSLISLVLTFTMTPDKDSGSGISEEDLQLAFYRDRFVALRTALGNYSKPYLFYNPDFAQSKALQWLVYKDEKLPVTSNGLTHTGGDNLLSFRLVQRYAYLVLFFDCDGTNWFRLPENHPSSSTANKNNDEQLSKGAVALEQQWPTLNECEFLGCTCNDLGQITHLMLNGENLVGQLPVEIGLLSNLVELNLGDNFLHGTIPWTNMGLGKLTNLGT